MKRVGIMIPALGVFLSAQAVRADWTPAQRLTWTLSRSEYPAVAVDSNSFIHVVWAEYISGNTEVCYKRSTNGGTTWSAAQRLTWTSGHCYAMAIAQGSSNVLHVVWGDDTPGNRETYYKRSSDGGTTWSAAQRLTWTSGHSFYPTIITGSGQAIHVVWDDDTPGLAEIYYKRSTDGGMTWSAAQRLTWTSGMSYFPGIAITSVNTIHVVWQEFMPVNYEIYYKRSDDGGTTWSAAQRLTWTPGASDFPAIAADPNDSIHVVWRDDTPGNQEVYYKGSTDEGATWTVAKRLTWTPGRSSEPALAIDSGHNIHIVWNDETPGKREIYYGISKNGGTTWSASTRLTWTSGDSLFPAMALDSSNAIHVVWHDDTPGNNEIYYKKGN